MAKKKKKAKKPSKTFKEKYPAKKPRSFADDMAVAGVRLGKRVEERKKAAIQAAVDKRLAYEANLLRGIESVAFGDVTQKIHFGVTVDMVVRAQFKMVCDREGWKMSQVINSLMKHVVGMHWHKITNDHNKSLLSEEDIPYPSD